MKKKTRAKAGATSDRKKGGGKSAPRRQRSEARASAKTPRPRGSSGERASSALSVQGTPKRADVSVRAGRSSSSAALSALAVIESIEQAYEAWRELRHEHASFVQRSTEERRKLEQQGAFLVGAVRAASLRAEPEHLPAVQAPQDAQLAPDGAGKNPLSAFLSDAERAIEQKRRALEEALARETEGFERTLSTIRHELEARVARALERTTPSLRLFFRPIGSSRTVLHLERLSDETAVLLLYALNRLLPVRYDFLSDDSTDDVALGPSTLYAEESVQADAVRPNGEVLRELVKRAVGVVPVKGFIPLFVPRPDGGEDFYRLLQRGPVLEVELLDGDTFRSVLEAAEGERFAGHLLRLKLEGVLDVELSAG